MTSSLFASVLTAQTYIANPSGAGQITGLRNWNAGGTAGDFEVMLGNLISVLMKSIVSICAAVFITGALLYIIGSFGKEDLKSNGKNMMIGSLIGLLIVQLARAIVHVTLYFMYAESF